MKLKENIKEFLNKWFGKGPDGKTNPHQLTLLTALIGFPVAVLLHLQMFLDKNLKNVEFSLTIFEMAQYIR